MMSSDMDDPAEYLASKYKYIFAIPGSRFSDLLVLATAGLAGLLAWLIMGDGGASFAAVFAALGVVPLLLNKAATRIFRGLPLHSTYRRLVQATLLTNYPALAILSISLGAEMLWGVYGLQTTLFSALFAAVSYLRVTLTSVIDGDRARIAVPWSLAEPLTSSLLMTIGLQPSSPVLLPLSVTLGAATGSATIILLGRKDRDGVSSLRLARGLSKLMLESDPNPLEDALEGLGKSVEKVSELFLLKGLRTGRLVALVVLPFHMGPFRRLGSSMLNWLVEAEASRRGFTAIAVKGCSTHRSDIISSRQATLIAREIVSRIEAPSDGWSREAALYPQIEVDGSHSLTLELAGRRIAIISLHPRPMEDLPEEVAAFADEYNVTVIDPHHSFSPNCKKLREEEISAVMRLAKDCASLGDGWRGSLRFSVAQSGVGSARYDQGIGPCGFSLLGLEIGGKKVALTVVDGNNALPHLRGALTSSLKEQGWEEAELITTDTHAVNGVILGGRGYVAVGEKISQEEVLETFSKLSRETLESLEEAEAKYLRVVHRGVMIYTDEAFRSLARRVRRHAALYLGLLIFTAVCAGLLSIL